MCVLTVVLLTFITVPAVHAYLQGYSYGDVVMQVIPFVVDMKRTIAEGLPLWAWNQFTGDNFIGIYGYYGLGSPFVWPLLLLPYKLIPAGLLVMAYAKGVLSAVSMRWYLKLMGVRREGASIGGLMYVFSSTWLLSLFYFIFTDAYVFFPLLLGTVELIFRGKKNAWLWTSLTVCLLCTSNFYMAVHAGIGTAIYTVVRLFSQEFRKQYLPLLLRVVASGILGIMLSAVIALPAALHALQSPRTLVSHSGISLWEATIITGIRVFYTFVPRLNECAPITVTSAYVTSLGFWIPVIGVLPAVLYMIKNMRSTLSIFTSIMFVTLYTPLSAIYNGVTGYGYVRGGFLFTVPVILISLLYLQKNGRPGRKSLMLYTLAGILVIAGMRLTGQYSDKTDHFWVCIEYLMAACSLISMWIAFYGKYSVRRLLFTCIGIIAVYVFSAGIAMRSGSLEDEFHQPENLHKPLIPDVAPEYVRSREPAIYNSAFTFNSGRVLRVPTPYFFNSVSNRTTVHYMDVAFIRTSHPLELEPEYNDAFFSVKNHVSINEDGSIETTPAPNYIPMGMAYDRYYYISDIPPHEGERYGRGLRYMLAALEVEQPLPDELKPYLKRWTPAFPDSNQMDSIINERRKHTFSSFTMDTRGFTATVNAPDTAVYMISVPPDPAFTATIDGKPLPVYNVNCGMTATIIPAGNHTVRFSYMPRGLKAGSCLTCGAILIIIGGLCVGRVKNRVKSVRKTQTSA